MVGRGSTGVLRKLRVVVVVGAALLVAVVVGFVWYGRLKALRFKLELPKKLGLNISQESHHVTLSRSVKGKTVFTVRAADQVQRTNGMIELHDVGIELYGRADGGTDRISGQDFLFDQKNGVMTGVGEVFIDLAAPAKGAKAGDRTAADGAKTVHVKTSGLVFQQAEQTAVTDKGIEFMAGGMTGTAVGAEYDAKSGTVELRNQVHVSGLQAGTPVVVTANWAELKRTENVVLLTGAKYTEVGAGGGESVAADHAEVHITAEGTPQRVDGQGHVVLTGPERGTMTGDRMELVLTDGGKARTGRLWGGVKYGYEGKGKTAQGTAAEVRVGFDAGGNPARAEAVGGVRFDERVAGGARGLTAEKVDLNFGAAGKRKAELKDAVATGGAVMRSVAVTAKGTASTEVRGDALTAKFVRVAGKDAVRTLDGTGHTVVHQVAVNGADETSTGETLAISFKEGAGAAQIERAVQRGGVRIVRSTPAMTPPGKKAVAAGMERAAGDEAVYDGVGNTVTVTGGAQVSDAASVLLADRVEMMRGTGDATAEGNVRVSYVQDGGKGEPVHVTAARAVEKKGAGTADFFGGGGKDARMWQEGSQVQAAVISFSQEGKDKGSRKMVAHGVGDADGVRAVLISAGKKDGSGGGPVRITGREMTYLEGAKTVEFAGKVRVQSADGGMNAAKAVAYLTDAKAVAPVAAGGLMGGKVEKVVATGAVEVEQPGRKGTGAMLVYTAVDQTFVLTGAAGDPPKVVDEARGTTTGAALRFRSGDDSVLISGGGDGQKVRSDTKVRQ